MDKVIKIEEYISETDKLKEKIRTQAKKILLLEKKQREPSALCQKCPILQANLKEIEQQKEQLASLLKKEVVTNELLTAVIEASVANSQPVASDWHSIVQQSLESKTVVENILQSENMSRQRHAAEVARRELANKNLSADLADIVQRKATADHAIVCAHKEIESLQFDVSFIKRGESVETHIRKT